MKCHRGLSDYVKKKFNMCRTRHVWVNVPEGVSRVIITNMAPTARNSVGIPVDPTEAGRGVTRGVTVGLGADPTPAAAHQVTINRTGMVGYAYLGKMLRWF
jgi:hypothetical protein